MKYYQNKIILITGAASGLGKEMSLALAPHSKQLLLIDINDENLNKVKIQCEKLGTSVQIFVINLLDIDALARLKTECETPDIIIANAGVGGVNPGFNFNSDIDSKIMGINYYGLVKTISPFLKEFVKRRSGHICGVSSLASMRGLPGASSYSASKAAVNNYLESIRMDLRPHNVFVTTILPGFIKTPMANHDEFDMPFTQDASGSAVKVLKAISKKKKIFAFPKIMYLGTLFNRTLPAFIYDFLMTKISGQSKNLKPRIL
jgi:short-subunit dehydrogenase